MSITERIKGHRSIRHFRDESVSEAMLTEIMECAARASTGGSMQLYCMIVTTDAERRGMLAALHFGSEIVQTAPVVITFCVDCRRLRQWLELRGETAGFDNVWGFAMGFSDALLAAQNALLAAESQGLGGCFLGTTFVIAPALARYLACPLGVVPVATLALGYPAESPELATRLPREAIVYREHYSDHSAAALRSMYEAHARTTFERFCSVPYVAHAVATAGIDDLAGYFARFMYPEALIATAGAYFQAAINGQGFGNEAKTARIRAVQRACESAAIAALHPVRQLAFSMALVSGHADHVLHLDPAQCESEISSFLSSRDPALLSGLMERGPFDIELRSRFLSLLAEFEAASTARAAE